MAVIGLALGARAASFTPVWLPGNWPTNTWWTNTPPATYGYNSNFWQAVNENFLRTSNAFNSMSAAIPSTNGFVGASVTNGLYGPGGFSILLANAGAPASIAARWGPAYGELMLQPNDNASQAAVVWPNGSVSLAGEPATQPPSACIFPPGGVYLKAATAPTAATIGGSVGSVTNHLLMNVGGSLIDYWSDGTTLYSKRLAP